MKLEEVLPALRAGKKIKRKIWNTEDAWHDSYNHGKEYFALADDWEVVGEENKAACNYCGKEITGEVVGHFTINGKISCHQCWIGGDQDSAIREKKDLRAQAAIAALGGMLAYHADKYERGRVVEIALEYADAILKKLEE